MRNLTYYDTPEFLTTAFHLITVFEVPIHLFGAYCILFKTPDSIKSVKWSMLNLHFWSVLLDLGFNVMTCPFMLYPAMAGFPLGLLAKIGVPTAIQTYLVVAIFSAVSTSIITIMENRYNILFARSNRWKLFRVPYLALNYLVTFTYFLYPTCMIPDQKIALEIVRMRHPEIHQFVFEYHVFVFALDVTTTVVSILIFSQFSVYQSFIFVYLLITNLQKSVKKTTLSQRTRKLQQSFIRAVSIQIFAPLLILAPPMFYIGPSIVLNYYNQTVNNFSFIVMSLHGLISTIIMLLIHEPYRNFCCALIWTRYWSAAQNPPNRTSVAVRRFTPF